jgi:hypothetical protein
MSTNSKGKLAVCLTAMAVLGTVDAQFGGGK